MVTTTAPPDGGEREQPDVERHAPITAVLHVQADYGFYAVPRKVKGVYQRKPKYWDKVTGWGVVMEYEDGRERTRSGYTYNGEEYSTATALNTLLLAHNKDGTPVIPDGSLIAVHISDYKWFSNWDNHCKMARREAPYTGDGEFAAAFRILLAQLQRVQITFLRATTTPSAGYGVASFKDTAKTFAEDRARELAGLGLARGYETLCRALAGEIDLDPLATAEAERIQKSEREQDERRQRVLAEDETTPEQAAALREMGEELLDDTVQALQAAEEPAIYKPDPDPESAQYEPADELAPARESLLTVLNLAAGKKHIPQVQEGADVIRVSCSACSDFVRINPDGSYMKKARIITTRCTQDKKLVATPPDPRPDAEIDTDDAAWIEGRKEALGALASQVYVDDAPVSEPASYVYNGSEHPWEGHVNKGKITIEIRNKLERAMDPGDPRSGFSCPICTYFFGWQFLDTAYLYSAKEVRCRECGDMLEGLDGSGAVTIQDLNM